MPQFTPFHSSPEEEEEAPISYLTGTRGQTRRSNLVEERFIRDQLSTWDILRIKETRATTETVKRVAMVEHTSISISKRRGRHRGGGAFLLPSSQEQLDADEGEEVEIRRGRRVVIADAPVTAAAGGGRRGRDQAREEEEEEPEEEQEEEEGAEEGTNAKMEGGKESAQQQGVTTPGILRKVAKRLLPSFTATGGKEEEEEEGAAARLSTAAVAGIGKEKKKAPTTPNEGQLPLPVAMVSRKRAVTTMPKSVTRGRPPGRPRRRGAYAQGDGWKLYIFKVLKQVHPGMSIS
jgi:hypothetical protein